VSSTAILAFLLTLNSTGGFDSYQYTFNVIEYLLVAKADEAISILFELFCSGCITLRLQVVDVTVYFYHKTACGTIKVGNERAQWMLPSEFQPLQLLVPKPLP
jgi:hypothetical protein